MSDLPKDNEQLESEDLFDFPEVQGFSPEFLEAARLQTEAANDHSREVEAPFESSFDEEDGFDDEFVDDFADLMNEPSEETPVEEPTTTAQATPVLASAQTSSRFDPRLLWGALGVLFVANMLWAWSWHSSETRLRGEMDQRFQSYLAQQKEQLSDVVEALTPVEVARTEDGEGQPALGAIASVEEGLTELEDIKRDLTHSRYETARAKAWRLIAHVDALPADRRAPTEAAARLLIAESYELRGTTRQELSR